MVGMWAPPSCVGQEPKEMNDVGGAHKDEHYFLDSPTDYPQDPPIISVSRS